jgi:peptidoglycan hydrolase-like protein with peptidoglycan-binding domain
VTNATTRGWGPGWPTERNRDQVRVARTGGTPVKTWVHRGIAPLVVEGLRRTEDEIGYDVRMLGGYCSRRIRGSQSPSNHSWGLAIDINWDNNPMVSGPLVTDFPSQMVTMWKSLGFAWGGDYQTRKDAMHFEFVGTPAQAAALTAALDKPVVGVRELPADQDGVPRPVLRRGAKGPSVTLLQEGLNGRGSRIGTDGIFGGRTLGAVVAFQRSCQLMADGIVGARTWTALGTPADQASPAVPRPLLRRGAQGPSVTLLQQRLNANGSDIGVDGIFGRGTYDAVVTFQASRTLAADGIVGKSTWSALG